MASLYDVANMKLRRQYDPGLSSMYSSTRTRGTGALPAPRPGVVPGDQLGIDAKQLAMIGLRQPQSQGPSTLQSIAERFNAPADTVGAVPQFMGSGQSQLRYVNGPTGPILLPPRVGGAVGATGAMDALADFAQQQQAEKMAARPSLDEMANRRLAYQERQQGRGAMLRDNRLVMRGQQLRSQGQPVPTLMADAMQNAQLNQRGRQADFERQQLALGTQGEVDKATALAQAQTQAEIERARAMMPLEQERLQQVNDAEFAQTQRLAPFQLQQELARAQQQAQIQAEAQKQQAMAQTAAQKAQYQDPMATVPDIADTATASNWLEDMMFRMSPEQFRQSVKDDSRVSPSRLQDVYREMEKQNSSWWNQAFTAGPDMQRRVALQQWLSQVLGKNKTSTTTPTPAPRNDRYGTGVMTSTVLGGGM